MKKFLVLTLLLVGCGQSANILSNDGTKVLGWCASVNWTKCVAETCPNGYTTVSPAEDRNGTALLKCK